MADWDLAAAAWNTSLTIFLLVIAALLFRIAQLAWRYGNKYGATSTGVSACLIGAFAVYNNIFYLLPFPFNGFMMYWVGGTLAVYLAYASIVWRKDFKSMKGEADRRETMKKFDKEFYSQDISFKMELVRKSFHLMGFLLVISFYGFGIGSPVTHWVNYNTIEFIQRPEVKYSTLWGSVADYPFYDYANVAASLTLFALIAAFFFATIPDLIRVLWGAKYSLYNRLTGAVLRGKEYKAAGPQIYLLTGVLLSYILFWPVGLFPVEIVMTGALVACFSDAIAAVVGRGWGKHKVTVLNGDQKSVEGFVAGVGLTFLIALIFVGPILALVAAVIFFLLDYFPVPVADNLLNPVAISFGLFFFAWLFHVPVGW
ncbi:MAG: hypothetical protein ACTSU5_09790 [Promethearchaeota archaeon]